MLAVVNEGKTATNQQNSQQPTSSLNNNTSPSSFKNEGSASVAMGSAGDTSNSGYYCYNNTYTMKNNGSTSANVASGATGGGEEGGGFDWWSRGEFINKQNPPQFNFPHQPPVVGYGNFWPTQHQQQQPQSQHWNYNTNPCYQKQFVVATDQLNSNSDNNYQNIANRWSKFTVDVCLAFVWLE